jgi:hypothetical protein
MKRWIRHPLAWLMLFTFLHGALYAALAHPWQAPDEYLHYEYLRLIDAKRSLSLSAEDRSSAMQWQVADTMRLFQHNRFRLLPTLPEAEFRAIPTPLGSKVFTPQPPLYYLLSLPIYWVLRSQSVLTQLYALRMFSVALHVLTVWLTYLLATRIFVAPGSEFKRLAAGAWVALWPTYTFISASYNNDNLAPPLVASALLLLVLGLQRRGEMRLWLAGALFCLLAALTKRTAWAMLPVLFLALVFYGGLLLRSERPRSRASGALLLLLGGGGIAAFALPLLVPFRIPADVARTLRLDPEALVRLSAFLGELPPVDWGWWFTFMLDSFTVQFGWLFNWVPPSLALGLRLSILALAVACLATLMRALILGRRRPASLDVLGTILLVAGVAAGVLLMAAQYIAAPSVYPPQGRYLFPFISAIGILAVMGWEAFWPARLRPSALLAGLLLTTAFDVYFWGVLLIPFFYL